MIKVLGLALYGPMAASTRYRLGQYVPGLAERGIALDIRYLLDDKYLQQRFNGGPMPWLNLLQTGWQRLRELRSESENFDLSIVYCELFPLLPAWAEYALLPKPYVYDFDDAFYLKYQGGRLGVMPPILGRKFDAIIAGAAAVSAGNQTLAGYARGLNTRTRLLPTVVDTGRYVPVHNSRDATTFTVGWIGSPSTAPYLAELIAPLALIAREGPVRLVVIGGKAPLIPGVRVDEVAWNEDTEIALLNSFDVGVMPLTDDEWARGKCAFKLIQYMACAVPVIASRVGANVDVVSPDCGYLASSEQEWVAALRILRDQPERRKTMGEAARTRVVQQYSLHSNLPMLEEIIRLAVEQGE